MTMDLSNIVQPKSLVPTTWVPLRLTDKQHAYKLQTLNGYNNQSVSEAVFDL